MESLSCRGKRFPHVARTLVVHSIRPRTGEPWRDGFPVFGVTSAGVSHGRVCTPGRLRRRGAMLRETPPPPPAGDLLLCCTTKKKARKRTPLPRPLRGFPPSGDAGRGLRKLALRAQTCEALFPPVITSSRHVRGDRKCGCSTVSSLIGFRRGSVSVKARLSRRAAEQRAGKSGAAV